MDKGKLAELLRDALENSDPDALVGATAEPGYRSTVDGRFDLAEVAHRFVTAARAAGLI